MVKTLFHNPHNPDDLVRRGHDPLPEGVFVWGFGYPVYQLADGDIIVYEIPEGEQPAQLKAINVEQQYRGKTVACLPAGSYILGYLQLEAQYSCYTAGKYFTKAEVQELAEKKRIDFLNAFFDSLFVNPE